MTTPTQSVSVRRIVYVSGSPSSIVPYLYDSQYDSSLDDVLDEVLMYDPSYNIQGYRWDGTRQVSTGGGDVTAPSVTGFAATSPSGLTIAITTFTASEAGVYFLITESATPPAVDDAGWNLSAPTTYAVLTSGTKVLYPWVKDAAGNVSSVYGSPDTVIVPLFLDQFTSDDAAPVASPRTPEPGPGTLTLVQVDGEMSISSGRLNIPAQASPTWGDNGWYTDTDIARAGLCLAFRVNVSALADGAVIGFGNGTGLGNASVQPNFYLSGNAASYFSVLENNWNLAPVVAAGTFGQPYDCYLIARPTIGSFVIRDTTLLWVGKDNSTATLRAKCTNKSMVATLDNLILTTLGAPWNTDNGIATQVLAGARSASDAFTHEANALIEFTVTTRPSGGNVDFRFRQQDATNYWQIIIDSTGAFTLNEVVDGTPTQRGTAAGVVTDGERCLIIADGSTIRGFSNSVLHWTYASASNFATATAGVLSDEGTGGSISDIITWPRTIGGAALSSLNFT